MQVIKSKISEKWLKASVMGSIWAANEILLGSFLHNIRVPLSGTIMAFLSVALMVSFCEIWKEKGMLWRGALIAALMKSISPSAIILGPMIGIVMEGIFMSICISLIGRNIMGYMLGGALAVMSVLVQKLAMLLINYGIDFLEIINNLFIYASEQLSFSKDHGLWLILALVGIYFLTGISGSFLGYYGGRSANKILERDLPKGRTVSMAHMFEKSEKQSYSIVLLFLHLAAVVLGMHLINSSRLIVIIPYLTIYFAVSIIYYKGAVRRLKRPAFWIWFIGITFLASYFLGDWRNTDGFNIIGLKEGLLMNLRAGLVMIGFTAISTELKNPVVKVIMYNRGAANLYQGMELAFGILPLILDSFPSSKELIRRPLKNIAGLIGRANKLLSNITQENSLRSKILILTGNVQEGKTTFLKKLILDLQSRAIKTGGFYTDVVLKNQDRWAYSLVLLKNGNSLPLCSIQPGKENTRRYGKFYFDETTLKKGNETLKKAVQENEQLIVIDEIGPLEMNDDGWAPGIEAICQDSGIPMIWTVRKSLAIKTARKWRVGDVFIVDIVDEKAPEEAQLAISSILAGNPG